MTVVIHSIVQKQTICEQNNSMETTKKENKRYLRAKSDKT